MIAYIIGSHDPLALNNRLPWHTCSIQSAAASRSISQVFRTLHKRPHISIYLLNLNADFRISFHVTAASRVMEVQLRLYTYGCYWVKYRVIKWTHFLIHVVTKPDIGSVFADQVVNAWVEILFGSGHRRRYSLQAAPNHQTHNQTNSVPLLVLVDEFWWQTFR